jgi:septum formation protein
MRLVLASASPRRIELLGRLGIPFTHAPADVQELDLHPDGAAALVMHNAVIKAAAISAQYPDTWILGSDTTVALGDTIYGKPVDLEDARRMLMELSGQTHCVYTAVCLLHGAGQRRELFYDSAKVTFKVLEPGVINNYFLKVNPLDKAGAYGIQSHSESIVASVEGELDTVMGLPLRVLTEYLNQIGFTLTDS